MWKWHEEREKLEGVVLERRQHLASLEEHQAAVSKSLQVGILGLGGQDKGVLSVCCKCGFYGQPLQVKCAV
jgi:hypothetical protein